LKRRVRIEVEDRDPIDIDRLARALIAIVTDLDVDTRAELAKRGQQRLDELGTAPTKKGEA
jgi:hypothetical protein